MWMTATAGSWNILQSFITPDNAFGIKKKKKAITHAVSDNL